MQIGNRSFRAIEKESAERVKTGWLDSIIVGPSSRYGGGIVDYSRQLMAALAEKGNVCYLPIGRTVPDLLYPGEIHEEEDRKRICTEMNGASLDLIVPTSWIMSGLWISRMKPSVLHLQIWNWIQVFAYVTIMSLVNRLAKSTRICLHFHNVAPHEAGFVFQFVTLQINRVLLALSNDVIVHTTQDRSLVKRIAPRFQGRVKVLPLPVYNQYVSQEEMSKNQARKILKLEHKRVLLFFGIVRHYKGLDVLLKALSLIEDEDVILVTAGRFWEGENEALEMIKQLKLKNRVRIINRWIDDKEIPVLFKASDLAVFPYKSASHSAALMTALAFQIPIVASKVGGLAEELRNNSSAILVEPNNPQHLADAIVESMANQKHRDLNSGPDGSMNWETLATEILRFWHLDS